MKAFIFESISKLFSDWLGRCFMAFVDLELFFLECIAKGARLIKGQQQVIHRDFVKKQRSYFRRQLTVYTYIHIFLYVYR